MSNVVCATCNGRGQTKQCRTEFYFVPVKRKNGTMGQQMITKKQGSGCLTCLGVGHRT